MYSFINVLMDESIESDLFFAYQCHCQVLLFWAESKWQDVSLSDKLLQ